jgi:hypothetical protein
MRAHFGIGGFPRALTMLPVRTNTTGTVQFDDPSATNRLYLQFRAGQFV